jgi:hypothetical protein
VTGLEADIHIRLDVAKRLVSLNFWRTVHDSDLFGITAALDVATKAFPRLDEVTNPSSLTLPKTVVEAAVGHAGDGGRGTTRRI